MEFHIVPNIKPKINVAPPRKPNLKFKLDSTLIESKHLLHGLTKKILHTIIKKNIPYEFKFLYRSSRDGVDTKSFHRNCDNKGATIFVAKIRGSTRLIGGYNPLDWNGNGWKYTTDSFIFNFTDGKNVSTAKLGYVVNTNYAVYCNSNFGPHMGDFGSNSTNNLWYRTGNN